MTSPEYSVVVPVYNEEEGLAAFIADLASGMDRLGDYELVFIDDGSKDKTWTILREVAKNSPRLVLLRFTRNFGHPQAVYAGLVHAKGKYIGVIDGDGQDPPHILAAMFDTLKEGYDVVYAVRKNRKEGYLKRFCFFAFYRMLSLISDFNLPRDSGDFSVMNRAVVEFIKQLNTPNPFVRGLRSWYGGEQKAFEYDRQARQAGSSKYSFFKLVNLAINGFTSCSKLPLRFGIYSGGVIALVALAYTLYLIILKIILPEVFAGLSGWATIIALTGLIGGANLLLTGLVGEYISHIFESTRQQPVFIIKEKIGGN